MRSRRAERRADGFGRGFGTEARRTRRTLRSKVVARRDVRARARAAPFAEPDPAFENSNASLDYPRLRSCAWIATTTPNSTSAAPAEASKKLNAGGESGVSGRGSSTGAVAAEETREAVEVACARASSTRAIGGKSRGRGRGCGGAYAELERVRARAAEEIFLGDDVVVVVEIHGRAGASRGAGGRGIDGERRARGRGRRRDGRGGVDRGARVWLGRGRGLGALARRMGGGGGRVVGAGRADVPDETCNASSSLSSLDE